MGAITVDNVFYPTPGTFPSYGIPVPAMNANTVTVAGDPGVNSRKGIVILMHPSANSDQIQSPPHVPSVAGGQGIAFGEFATTMASNGWVTVMPLQPVDLSNKNTGYQQSMCNLILADAGHGSMLVSAYRAWFHKLVLYLKRKFHVANPPIIVLGFSLGAWVAAVIAKNETDKIVGYACHELPTIWSQLSTASLNTAWSPLSGQNSSGADLGTSYLSGVTIPGIIGHAETPPGTYTDQVVGWTSGTNPQSNGSLIAASAGGAFTNYAPATAAPDHVFFSGDATEYSGWITGTSPFSGYSATF